VRIPPLTLPCLTDGSSGFRELGEFTEGGDFVVTRLDLSGDFFRRRDREFAGVLCGNHACIIAQHGLARSLASVKFGTRERKRPGEVTPFVDACDRILDILPGIAGSIAQNPTESANVRLDGLLAHLPTPDALAEVGGCDLMPAVADEGFQNGARLGCEFALPLANGEAAWNDIETEGRFFWPRATPSHPRAHRVRRSDTIIMGLLRSEWEERRASS
jgi:hypothetical protein